MISGVGIKRGGNIMFRNKGIFPIAGTAFILTFFLWVVLHPPEIQAQSLEEAARQEGKVLLYFGMAIPDIQTIANAFMKKYPFIKVEYYRAGGANLLQKILAEKATGKFNADVIQLVGSLVGAYKEEGILAKYVSPEARFYSEAIKDPEGFWINFYSTYKLFIYNTNLVSKEEAPKTYEDLLKPRWKRQIGISRNEFEWYIGMLDALGDGKGRQFMKRLGEQQIRVHAGLPQVTTLLAAGEFPLGLSNQAWAFDVMKKKAPVAILNSFNPIIDVPRCLGIAAGAPHPNAAKLMVDFLLAKEGQNVLNGIGRTSIRPDVKRGQAIEDLNLKLEPFRPKSSKQMEGLIKEYRKVIERS